MLIACGLPTPHHRVLTRGRRCPPPLTPPSSSPTPSRQCALADDVGEERTAHATVTVMPRLLAAATAVGPPCAALASALVGMAPPAPVLQLAAAVSLGMLCAHGGEPRVGRHGARGAVGGDRALGALAAAARCLYGF